MARAKPDPTELLLRSLEKLESRQGRIDDLLSDVRDRVSRMEGRLDEAATRSSIKVSKKLVEVAILTLIATAILTVATWILQILRYI